MVEKVLLGSSASDAGTAAGALTTKYVSFIYETSATNQSSTEVQVASKFNFSCTLRKLSFTVTTNNFISTSTVTVRVAESDTSLSIEIPSGTTGTFSNTSSSASVSSGDLVCLKTYTGSGGGGGTNFGFTSCTVEVESTSQAATMFGGRSPNQSSASTTTYIGINGNTNLSAANEERSLTVMREDCTVSNLQAYISTNGRAQATTYRVRKNSANGNGIITVTGSTTGFFEDTTNSDSLVSGDKLGYQSVLGTGFGNVAASIIGLKYIGSVANRVVLVSNYSASLTSGSTNYTAVTGSGKTSTESNSQSVVVLEGTLSSGSIYVHSNASTTTVTAVLRKNTSDTDISISISSGTTGAFTSADSVSVAADDLINWKLSGANATLQIAGLSALFTGTVTAGGYAQSQVIFFM